ncbi:hypothetical protein ACFV61_30310, partial [Kitasatospora sp. NPDC059817]
APPGRGPPPPTHPPPPPGGRPPARGGTPAGPPVDFESRVAAGLLAAVDRTVFTEVFRRLLAGDEAAAITAAVRPSAVRAFDRLEGALGTFAVRPGS